MVAKCYHFIMPQPVKVSDELLVDARVAGEATERSIAGQIEYWARLGKAVDLELRAAEVMRLKQVGAARPLSELIAAAGTRRKLRAYLATRPFPHFEPARGKPGLLVKIDKDGTRTPGRFVKRLFRPAR